MTCITRIKLFIILLLTITCFKINENIEKWPNDNPKLITIENDKYKQIKSYYSNGSIEYEANLIDDMYHGKTLHWFKNGNIKSSANYFNNKFFFAVRTMY